MVRPVPGFESEALKNTSCTTSGVTGENLNWATVGTGMVDVVVVDVVVDVVDSVMITFPGPLGTRGELSQPVDRTARQSPLRSHLRILQTQIYADHGCDGGVKTAVFERNHGVQGQEKLTF